MKGLTRAVLAALVCLLAASAVEAQTAETEDGAPAAKITLAKKEKDGTITENPERFSSRDVPVICYVDLAEDAPVEVKLLIAAVKSVGLRPDSPVVTVKYKTKEGENMVTFTAKPGEAWAPGDYRADVFLDGVRKATRPFVVTEP